MAHSHSSLVDYLAQVKNWKNEPTHSDCVLSCPPLKILGGVYESSWEHVFHKGPPLKFISVSFIQRGDPY